MTSAGLSLTLPDIAFCGKMGAGKTTAAELLTEIVNYRRVSVATGLKRLARELYGPDADKNREICQALGTDLRKHDANVWTNQACKEIDKLKSGVAVDQKPRVCVDDMRFPSEYWAFKERGFLIVEIYADRNIRVARLQANGKLQDEAQLEHDTETALDDTDEFPRDYVLVNEGERSVLHEQLVDLLKTEVSKS